MEHEDTDIIVNTDSVFEDDFYNDEDHEKNSSYDDGEWNY